MIIKGHTSAAIWKDAVSFENLRCVYSAIIWSQQNNNTTLHIIYICIKYYNTDRLVLPEDRCAAVNLFL